MLRQAGEKGVFVVRTGKAAGRRRDGGTEAANSIDKDTSVFEFNEDDEWQKNAKKTPIRKRAAYFRAAFTRGKKQKKHNEGLSALKKRCSLGRKCRSVAFLNEDPNTQAKREYKTQPNQYCIKGQLSSGSEHAPTSPEIAGGFNVIQESDQDTLHTKNRLQESLKDLTFGNNNTRVIWPASSLQTSNNIVDLTADIEVGLTTGGFVCVSGPLDDSPAHGDFTGQMSKVVIIAEGLVLWESIHILSAQLTFTQDTINLEMEGDSMLGCGNGESIQWALDEINRFASYTNLNAGYALVELGVTADGVLAIASCLREASLSNEDGCNILFKVDCRKWPEQQRQITALCDHYKLLWKPLCEDEHLEKIMELLRGFETIPVQHIGNCASAANGVPIWMDIVYPKEDPDAVTITKTDFQLLNPMEFLSDTIIDFYIKHLQTTLSDEHKQQFYFYNSFFFRKLTDLEYNISSGLERRKAAFDGVKRWTSKINIFDKDYLFVPIMQSAHWSLIIICYPNQVLADDQDIGSSKASCILHLDSLEGCHTGLEEPIRNYLAEAWIQKFGCYGDNVDAACKRLSEIEFIHAKVPQQTNYSDCGLFLLHYVELFIRQEQKIPHFLTADWFDPVEASAKRVSIRDLIFELLIKDLSEKGVDVENYTSGLFNDYTGYTEFQGLVRQGNVLPQLEGVAKRALINATGNCVALPASRARCIEPFGNTSCDVAMPVTSLHYEMLGSTNDFVDKEEQGHSLPACNHECQQGCNACATSYALSSQNTNCCLYSDSVVRPPQIPGAHIRSHDHEFSVWRVVRLVPMMNERTVFLDTGASNNCNHMNALTAGDMHTSVGQLLVYGQSSSLGAGSDSFVCATPENDHISCEVPISEPFCVDITSELQCQDRAGDCREEEMKTVAMKAQTGKHSDSHTNFFGSMDTMPFTHMCQHMGLIRGYNTAENVHPVATLTRSLNPSDCVYYGEAIAPHFGKQLEITVGENVIDQAPHFEKQVEITVGKNVIDQEVITNCTSNADSQSRMEYEEVTNNFQESLPHGDSANGKHDIPLRFTRERQSYALLADELLEERPSGEGDTSTVDVCQASNLDDAHYISSDEATGQVEQTQRAIEIENLLVLGRKHRHKKNISDMISNKQAARRPLTRSAKKNLVGKQEDKSTIFNFMRKRRRLLV